MDFKKQKAIYLQIAETICERILQGDWKEEERMASVRDVAAEMGVNPNTVLRSFDHLQEREIIFNRRGVGYFVAANAKELITKLHREEFLQEEWPAVLQKIQMLGITFSPKNSHSFTMKNNLKLYCCPFCGAISVASGNMAPTCCGSALTPLTEKEAENLPTISEMDGEYLIEYNVPMTKEDYIAAVVVERYDRVDLIPLYPEQAAQVRLESVARTTLYTVFRQNGNVWAEKKSL